MSEYEQTTVKNGTGSVIYLWVVHNYKPKCWREGHEYKFNRELVNSQYLRTSYEK